MLASRVQRLRDENVACCECRRCETIRKYGDEGDSRWDAGAAGCWPPPFHPCRDDVGAVPASRRVASRNTRPDSVANHCPVLSRSWFPNVSRRLPLFENPAALLV